MLASAAWIVSTSPVRAEFSKDSPRMLVMAQLARANIPCCETGWTVPPMQFACKWRGEVWTELWGSIRECIKGGTLKIHRFFMNHFYLLLRSRTFETSTYGYEREKGQIVM